MIIIYRIIYNSFVNKILRNVFKLFGNKIPISISGTLELNYKKYEFKLLTNPSCFVTQALFEHGTAAYEFTPLFEKLIKQSDTFFDVGANIGYFSILGSKINPNVKIYSFEPARGPLHYLKSNVALNECKNVTIIDKAIADQTGQLEFFEVVNPKYTWLKHQLNGSNSLQNQHGLVKAESYKVNVITLNDVIKQNNVSKVDLIKLDTECTEHYILNSSLDVVQEYRPIIISEIYDVIEADIQLFLDKLNDYELYHYDLGNIKLINKLEEVRESNERNFIICPKEKSSQLF
ncbi:MAG: hypothetical protein RLZZ175_27 [Bacteroidota bacterium]|jgi:FkbM family methyltransferase